MKLLYTLLVILGFQLFALGQSGKIDSLRNRLRTAEGDTLKVKIHIQLANLFFRESIDSADYHINKIKTYSLSSNYKKGISAYYSLKAQRYNRVNLYDSAMSYIWRAINLYKNEGDSINLIKRYNTLGSILLQQSKYDSAIVFYTKVVKNFHLLDSAYHSIVYNNISIACSRKGALKNSLEYAFKALRMAEQMKNVAQQASILMHIGNVYNSDEDFAKAKNYLGHALNIIKNEQIKHKMGAIYNNFGIVYKNLGKNAKAMEYFRKASHYNQKFKDRQGLSISYQNISLIYLNQKKYDLALDYQFKVLDLHENINSKHDYAYSYKHLGYIYLKLDKTKKAILYLKKSLEFCKGKGDNRILRLEVYQHLSLAFQKQKNYIKSIYFKDEYISLKDSLQLENKADAIVEIEEKYETEKIEQEKIQAEKDLEIQKIISDKERFIKNLSIMSASLIVFAAIGRVYLYRKQKISLEEKKTLAEEKQKLQKELGDTYRHAIDNAISAIIIFGDKNKADKDVESDFIKKACKSILEINKILGTSDTLKNIHVSSVISKYLEHSKIKQDWLDLDIMDLYTEYKIGIKILFLVIEFCDNAYKYAFEGIKNPILKIKLQDFDSNNLLLTFKDNGKGFDKEVKPIGTGRGLKWIEYVIEDLSEKQFQLDTSNGTHWKIFIKKTWINYEV